MTTNLNVVNGLPTYGNWGGPGWSGGQQASPASSLTDAQKQIPAIDPLDQLFKDHDINYDDAAKLADSTDQAIAILNADLQLMGGMLTLGSVTDPLAESYRNAAVDAFEKKIIWDVLQIGIDSISSALIKGVVDPMFHMFDPIPVKYQIAPATSNNFNSAQKFIQRFGDPLTLDLNGDGIHTVPLSTPPLLFDINASGVKISTGWIAPSDGLLVMDRNGNGIVDNGSELFGDATPAYGTTATGRTADGFAALAQEDTNHDGMVNAQDANWANLRVWQDLNQDGLSQGNELTSLTDAGIASFNTARTLNSQMLPSGNQMSDLGTFTRTDGSIGATAAPQGMADINLALDTFHRTFVDTIPLTAQAQALPDMQGSGKVRDMREAASLQTAAGLTFATALANFSAAGTREEQLAQIDNLISAWGATAEFGTLQSRAAAHGYTFTLGLDATRQTRLAALEAFNGRGYFKMPWEGASFGESARQGLTIGWGGNPKAMVGQLWGQASLLDQSYAALRESVYQALLPQTRLKPYLDAVRYSVDANGLQVDFSAVQTAFANTLATNPDKALGDLLEFNRYGKTLFQGTSWETQGWEELGAMLNNATMCAQQMLGQLGTAGEDVLMAANDASFNLFERSVA